ncbi:MAG: zinc ribbon domain-containing protein [Coriobacteriia bacterium]
MQCPNCQNEVREGAVFCGSCGAAIPSSAPQQPATSVPATPVPTATPQQVTPNPQSPVEQAEYQRQMAEYQRKQAEYEQQKAAYEQYQQQAAAQTAPQPTVTAPQPVYAQPAMAQQAPKKKTGLIIGIVAVVVLVLGGLAIAGILIARSALDDAVQDMGAEFETPVTGGEETPGEEAPSATAGYATAEEAAAAALAADGFGDWVTQLYQEDEGSATYWAGPPNSEWVSELTILKQSDGTWIVERIGNLQFGGDVSMTPADEAALTVTDFLTAIQQDRADDAHALTIEPFSLDGASAAYSGGEFTAFEIVSVEEQSDGTAWVQTTETWYGTASDMWYYVVPTDAGYRISNVEVR